jgi:hypothetical protein
MGLSPRVRLHALAALANLAKYQGRYPAVYGDEIERYSLKWTVGNESLRHLQRFFNPDRLTLDVRIQKVKEMVRLLPHPFNGSNSQVRRTCWSQTSRASGIYTSDNQQQSCFKAHSLHLYQYRLLRPSWDSEAQYPR